MTNLLLGVKGWFKITSHQAGWGVTALLAGHGVSRVGGALFYQDRDFSFIHSQPAPILLSRACFGCLWQGDLPKGAWGKPGSSEHHIQLGGWFPAGLDGESYRREAAEPSQAELSCSPGQVQREKRAKTRITSWAHQTACSKREAKSLPLSKQQSCCLHNHLQSHSMLCIPRNRGKMLSGHARYSRPNICICVLRANTAGLQNVVCTEYANSHQFCHLPGRFSKNVGWSKLTDLCSLSKEPFLSKEYFISCWYQVFYHGLEANLSSCIVRREPGLGKRINPM